MDFWKRRPVIQAGTSSRRIAAASRPRLAAQRGQVLPLGGLLDVEVPLVDPLPFREALPGLGQRAGSLVRGLFRRAGDLDLQVRLARDDPGYRQRQPPRRAEGADLAVREALRVERGAGGGGQVLEGARDEARGDLLGADLQQQVHRLRHGYFTTMKGVRSATGVSSGKPRLSRSAR
jgi:hypothetical protein